MELAQKVWDAYEWAWERRDRRVDDYILMQGSMIQDHMIHEPFLYVQQGCKELSSYELGSRSSPLFCELELN